MTGYETNDSAMSADDEKRLFELVGHVSGRVNGVETHIAEMRQDMIRMFAELREDNKETRIAVKALQARANRWAGGFIVLAGLGGVLTWVFDLFSGVRNLSH